MKNNLYTAIMQVLTESKSHPMINVDGEMKHMTNSNGQQIHHSESGIRNFHRWFSNSKIVDKQKRPLVMYHGTASDIQKFDTAYAGKGNDQYGSGFYFSDNPEIANSYVHGNTDISHNAAPNVIPVYLSLKKPIYTSDTKPLSKDHIRRLIKSAPDHMDTLSNYGDVDYEGYNSVLNSAVNAHIDIPKFHAMNHIHNDFYNGNTQEFLKNFKKITGHDGAIEDTLDHKIVVVFDPNDIKSATGNIGEYGSSHNINENRF